MSFLDLTFLQLTDLTGQMIHVSIIKWDSVWATEQALFFMHWIALKSCPPQHHWCVQMCYPSVQSQVYHFLLGRLNFCSSITHLLNPKWDFIPIRGKNQEKATRSFMYFFFLFFLKGMIYLNISWNATDLNQVRLNLRKEIPSTIIITNCFTSKHTQLTFLNSLWIVFYLKTTQRGSLVHLPVSPKPTTLTDHYISEDARDKPCK